jgi:hypothetical protein
MAKPKKSAKGHNSLSLSGDEREALFLLHLSKCREEDKRLADAMETIKEIKAGRTKVRNLAKQEGFPLKHIDSILYREGLSRSDLELEAELHRWMDQMAGLPVGGQGDLFAGVPETAKDAMGAEGDGYAAGLRGADPFPPPSIPTNFHTDWMKGWHAAQEKLAWALAKGAEVTKAREERKLSADLEPQDQPVFDDAEMGDEA